MIVAGRFKTPVMAHQVESYPAVGDGAIEVDGMAIKITSRELAMPWLGWVLGAAGLLLGFGLAFALSVSGKLILAVSVAPAIAGFAAGHVVGRAIGVRRPPRIGVIGLEGVCSATSRGAICEIVVQPFTAPLKITFAPSRPEDVEPLVAELRRYITARR
jgi:hypothetical protein